MCGGGRGANTKRGVVLVLRDSAVFRRRACGPCAVVCVMRRVGGGVQGMVHPPPGVGRNGGPGASTGATHAHNKHFPQRENEIR